LAFDRLIRLSTEVGWEKPQPRPRFGHGVELRIVGGPVLIGSYHPSQQNTFTGRLTPDMLDGVFQRARTISKAF
jgi:uracil-DNA glycosylase